MNDPSPVRLEPWDPLHPREAKELFAGAAHAWWVAGGWAIDLFVGARTRDHADLDIGVFRVDQAKVRHTLAGWDLYATDPPGTLRPWRDREMLGDAITGVWCRRHPKEPWRVQLLLNATAGTDFAYRRDPSIVVPLADAVLTSAEGIPYLAPQIQLLFKARDPRPKDETDFATTRPLLSRDASGWLRDNLERLHPGHPWLAELV